MNQNFALIIGVHDYRSYDASGGSNVPGARNDARAWYRTCLAMGFSPENIRVLTSPPLDMSERGGGAAKVQFGEADRKSIVEGLDWLSEKIGGSLPASGLVTFSGHGEEGENGFPLLCPSDVTTSLEEVIDVGSLREKSSATVKDNLTMMLDCCHAQAGMDAAQSMRMRLRAKQASVGLPDRARSRVIAACRRQQQSVGGYFQGEEMGAFTWAATSALGQWKTVVHDGVAEVGVSYVHLVQRTRALLSVLSFEQEPTLSGPKGLAKLAFLHPGTVSESDKTNRAPTAVRDGRQLDGGQLNANQYQKYSIACWCEGGIGIFVADIYVTADIMGSTPPTINGQAMQPGTEYWVFYPNAVSMLARNYTSVTLVQMPAMSGPTSTAINYSSEYSCYVAVEQTQWERVTGMQWPEGSYVFTASPTASAQTIQGAALVANGTIPVKWWWVQTGTSNLTSNDMRNAQLNLPVTRLSTGIYCAASIFSPLTSSNS